MRHSPLINPEEQIAKCACAAPEDSLQGSGRSWSMWQRWQSARKLTATRSNALHLLASAITFKSAWMRSSLSVKSAS
jgi:hypothetical protein